MERSRPVVWRLACWAWVAVPILGLLPKVPVRLAVVWLWLIVSWVVIGLGLAWPRRAQEAQPFGWLALGVVGLGLWACWSRPTDAFIWVWQLIIWLSAAATLAQHGDWAWLRQAVIGCALAQWPIALLTRMGGLWQWPHHPSQWCGTVGSETPMAVLLGLAAIWSRGWGRWLLGCLAAVVGCGTVAAFMLAWLLRQVPWPRWMLRIALGIGLLILIWWWREPIQWRLETWADAHLTWQGVGFGVLPGGWRDDTTLGRLLEWRFYLNAYLDWVQRFGVAGLTVMTGIGWWCWRHRAGNLLTLSFLAWVLLWQSVEPWPVIGLLVLVVWIGLTQHRRMDALDSV